MINIGEEILKKARENAEIWEEKRQEAAGECRKDTGAEDELMEYLDVMENVRLDDEVRNLASSLSSQHGFNKEELEEYAEKCIEYAGEEIQGRLIREIHSDDAIINATFDTLDELGEELEKLEDELNI